MDVFTRYLGVMIVNEYIKKEDAENIMLGSWGESALWKLRHLPSADVVEVVRCKDCKHHEELLNNNDENVLCWVHDIDVIVDGNGYCSYGEQKE